MLKPGSLVKDMGSYTPTFEKTPGSGGVVDLIFHLRIHAFSTQKDDDSPKNAPFIRPFEGLEVILQLVVSECNSGFFCLLRDQNQPAKGLKIT